MGFGEGFSNLGPGRLVGDACGPLLAGGGGGRLPIAGADPRLFRSSASALWGPARPRCGAAGRDADCVAVCSEEGGGGKCPVGTEEEIFAIGTEDRDNTLLCE